MKTIKIESENLIEFTQYTDDFSKVLNVLIDEHFDTNFYSDVDFNLLSILLKDFKKANFNIADIKSFKQFNEKMPKEITDKVFSIKNLIEYLEFLNEQVTILKNLKVDLETAKDNISFLSLELSKIISFVKNKITLQF